HAWTKRQTVFETSCNVEEILSALRVFAVWRTRPSVFHFPDSGKIRLAVGCSRRRSGEIRLTIRVTRNAGSGIVQPLRPQRRCQYGQHGEVSYVHLALSMCCMSFSFSRHM